MTINNITSSLIALDSERTLTGPFTGVAQLIGSALTVNPKIIIFDNQSTVEVAVGNTASMTWKTFAPGQALVLDNTANHGKPNDFTFAIGTQFYGTGTGGTGSFRISIVHGA